MLLLPNAAAFGEEQTLSAIKTGLTFSSLTTQKITAVTENFELPVKLNGAFIVWESDNENAVLVDGGSPKLWAKVIRPPFGEGFVSATLTAYITKDGEMTEKSFLIRVKERDIGFTYSKTVEEAYSLFEMEFLSNQNILGITNNLYLPKIDSQKVSVTYKSDNTDVIGDDGKVTRNYDKDITVNFTVFFTEGFETFKVSYSVTVKAYTDEEIRDFVKKDLEEAETKVKSGANLMALEKNISLPSKGKNGSTITWETSDSTVISNGGIIKSGAEEKNAVLTARADFHGAYETKTIDIKIASKTGAATEIDGNKGLGNVGGGNGGSIGGATKPTEDNSAKKNSFKDVPETHWAFEAVEQMKKKNIINGTAEGIFEPESQVTREQAAKLIANTFNITAEKTKLPFKDVNENDWYYSFVSSLYASGIINGVSDTIFGAGDKITRQDFCVMLFSAMKYKEAIIVSSAEESFADYDEIADYAKEAVGALCRAKLIEGMDDGTFMPHKSITRAEAAALLARTFEN